MKRKSKFRVWDLFQPCNRKGTRSDAASGGGGTWRSAGWFGVLVAAVGMLGFLPGALVFFMAFLRRKAQQSWGVTLLLTGCVIVTLAAVANLLLVELWTRLARYMGDSKSAGREYGWRPLVTRRATRSALHES